MKLYDVPRNTKIRIKDANDVDGHPPSHRDFESNEILLFSHIDGMYSLCFDSDKHPVHLAAWTEVEIVQ